MSYSFLSNSLLSINQWFHIVLIADKSKDSTFAYLNGVRIESRLMGANGTIGANTLALLLGKGYWMSNGIPSNFYNGKLDDISIWNIALTASEVQQLYTAQSPCNLTSNFFSQDTLRACGNSITLDALNAGSTYSWNTGASSKTISITSTGWYKCTVSQGACTATDSVFVSLVNANIVQE
ncbi:MAG: hypothetical protein IPI62_00570 [Bacteroidetes bacterium]|nr:hypothetical protein [Bacteroidota bacterium]